MLLGSKPEPWEGAISFEQLQTAPVDLKALTDINYNHPAWFFSSGSHPRWLGYTLGYHMVESWLQVAGDIEAELWVNVPAATVIEAAARAGLVSQYH